MLIVIAEVSANCTSKTLQTLWRPVSHLLVQKLHKLPQRHADFASCLWLTDHFKKESKLGRGAHCLTAYFVIENVPAAVRAQLWDLMIREAGGGQCLWSANSWTRGLTRAQYSSQDRKREWERETGQQQHRQGDHINTHQPPPTQIPNSAARGD